MGGIVRLIVVYGAVATWDDQARVKLAIRREFDGFAACRYRRSGWCRRRGEAARSLARARPMAAGRKASRGRQRRAAREWPRSAATAVVSRTPGVRRAVRNAGRGERALCEAPLGTSWRCSERVATSWRCSER
eukprot:975651-Prymnesium_polylepis.1